MYPGEPFMLLQGNKTHEKWNIVIVAHDDTEEFGFRFVREMAARIIPILRQRGVQFMETGGPSSRIGEGNTELVLAFMEVVLRYNI